MNTRHENEDRQGPPASVFIAATVVIFFSALSAADSVGFVPCALDGSCAAKTTSVALSDLPELGEATLQKPASVLPTGMEIGAIDLDLPVQNPDTRDIPTLDEYLKDGPVRYVDSAKLGEDGNVLIFAHTSHLPVVRNQMYKAFNRVPELKAGDTITVKGDGKTYLYSVTGLHKADASQDFISLAKTGKKLTLVTCNTLSSKDARFVLEAEYVGTI